MPTSLPEEPGMLLPISDTFREEVVVERTASFGAVASISLNNSYFMSMSSVAAYSLNTADYLNDIVHLTQVFEFVRILDLREELLLLTLLQAALLHLRIEVFLQSVFALFNAFL